MLLDGIAVRKLKIIKVLFSVLFLLSMYVQLNSTLSVSDGPSSTVTTALKNNSANYSDGDDLYVIKAVVYEIGILTDAENSTNNGTEREEEVHLSFYNPPSNTDMP